MKVLHVMPSIARAFGGPTEAVLGFLEAGRIGGVEGHVVAPRSDESDLAWFRERAGVASVHTLSRYALGSRTWALGLVSWLAKHERAYDVLHVHGLLNPVSSLTTRALRRHGRPYVIRPFGTLSRYTFAHRRRMAKRLWLQLLDEPNLRAARAVHFTTAEERDEAAWHGIEFRDAVVIPPPITVASGSLRATRAGRRALFLSRLHPQKGLEALIGAWPLVRAQVPGAELVIAGDGDRSYVASLRDRASELGSASGICFVGFATADLKARLFAEADVFVLPSFHENFGVAVVEALAAGLPVVITEEVQLASFVRSTQLGIVTSRERERLAASIVRGLTDHTLRHHTATRASRLLEQSFSLQTVGRQLGELYARVAAP